jgi:GH43 family beta-xylosidase
LVVQELAGMMRLVGEPRTVLRARSDWQRYAKDRAMYGRVFDWHTLEGPCVLRSGGRYYCMYSGGSWQSAGYGVDFGVADAVLGPYDDRGNEAGPRVLRTVPGNVIGPGHHSIVVGPDEQTLFICYHAWDAAMTARRLFIDPLILTDDGPRCDGPSWTPRTLRAR